MTSIHSLGEPSANTRTNSLTAASLRAAPKNAAQVFLQAAGSVSKTGFTPVLTDAQKSRLDDAKQALQTMTQIKSQVGQSTRQSRSDQAQARLRQLLEEFKKLRAVMLCGDPKTMARQAAQLAKEIAAAAKDFAASASDGSATVSAPSVDTSASATATATATTSAGATDAAVAAESAGTAGAVANGGGGDDAAQAAAAAAGAAATATAAAATAETKPPEETGKDDANGKSGTPAEAAQSAGSGNAAQDRATETRALIAAGTAGYARATTIKAEGELFNEVKMAVGALRQMVERAAREAKRKHDAPGEDEGKDQLKDVATAEKAVDAAVQTIGHHDEGLPAGTAPTDGTATDGTTTDTGGVEVALGSVVAAPTPLLNLLV